VCACSQVLSIRDDKEASRLLVDLLALAPIVSGRERSKSACEFFSSASFAASLLLKALVVSYNQAAARYRGNTMAPVDLHLAFFLAANKPRALFVRDEKEAAFAKIELLLSSMNQADRRRWEIKCAHALLSSAHRAPVRRSSEKSNDCLELRSYSHNSLIDRHDGLCEILGLYAKDGCRHELRSWPSETRQVPTEHSLMDMLYSAPLAYSRLHKSLFEGLWSKSVIDDIGCVLMEIEGKTKEVARSGKELGLSLEGGKFGTGSSIFNTYADREVQREHDPLVSRHDDEWTQLGRVKNAEQCIEAKLGMSQIPMEEMSGGIDRSVFFSMAAVEKQLEQKIPRPVYPEMRVKRQITSPRSHTQLELMQPDVQEQVPSQVAVETETKEGRSSQKSSPPLTFADILRKAQGGASHAMTAASGWAPLPGRSEGIDSKMPSPTKPCAWAKPGEIAVQSGGDAEIEAAQVRQQDKSVWGGNAAKVLSKQWSAAEAAQAATGILFAEPREKSCPQVDEHMSAQPAVAHAAAARSPENLNSKGKPHTERKAGQQRIRYNPLRPSHQSLSVVADSRRSTVRCLHAEIEAFLKEVEPTEASRKHRHEIVQEVKAAVTACWPDASVEVYGSFATNLFLPHSDVDLLVMNSQPSGEQTAQQVVSQRLRGMTWCRYVKAIENASVPVVKLTADVSLLRSQLEQQHKVEQADHLEEQPACIAVDLTLDCNISDAPIALRDFVCGQLDRFPVIRPLVLVLKHFLFKQGLNDAYQGGLSSHAVILLLIFYFNIPEVAAAHKAGLDPGSPGYIDKDCWYGEWLMRVMQWLSEFPFSDVGIVLEGSSAYSYVPLTQYGYGMLTRGECDPALPDVDASLNELHIEDPFNNGNIAKGCFEWWLVRRSLQGAYRILNRHEEPSPLQRIYGGVGEGRWLLASIFDRAQVSSSVEALQRTKSGKVRKVR
jgi:predicted nucleotidyltransferase